MVVTRAGMNRSACSTSSSKVRSANRSGRFRFNKFLTIWLRSSSKKILLSFLNDTVFFNLYFIDTYVAILRREFKRILEFANSWVNIHIIRSFLIWNNDHTWRLSMYLLLLRFFFFCFFDFFSWWLISNRRYVCLKHLRKSLKIRITN